MELQLLLVCLMYFVLVPCIGTCIQDHLSNPNHSFLPFAGSASESWWLCRTLSIISSMTRLNVNGVEGILFSVTAGSFKRTLWFVICSYAARSMIVRIAVDPLTYAAYIFGLIQFSLCLARTCPDCGCYLTAPKEFIRQIDWKSRNISNSMILLCGIFGPIVWILQK